MKKLLCFALATVLLVSACQPKGTTSGEPVSSETTASVDNTAVIAKVGDLTLTQGSFDRNLALIKFNIESNNPNQKFDQLKPEEQAQIKKDLYNALVDELASVQAAKKAGITLKKEQLDADYQSYVTQAFGSWENPKEEAKNLVAYFKANDITEDFIKRALEYSAIRQQLKDQIRADLNADTKLIEELKNQTVQVEASHLLVALDEKEKIDKIYDELQQSPDKWNELVKKWSIDTGNAEKGGALGYFYQYGQMVQPFADAAFSTPVGTISKPVKTQFGWHLIKVTGSRTYKEIEKADKQQAASALEVLLGNKESEKFKALVDEVKKTSDVMTTEVTK
ncbi:peptidylprolyl isomerase [Guggenheimella bovis]